MRRLHTPTLHDPRSLAFAALVSLLIAAPVAASTTCAAALDRPASFREVQSALAPGERLCYAPELPSAGLWLVDVSSAPGADPAGTPPRLTAVGQLCDHPGDDGGAAAHVLHRLTGGAIIRVDRPGRYLFCIAGRDPGEVLGQHRVTSLFAAPHLKGDPDEDEPDPDPFLYAPDGEDLAGTSLPLLSGGLGDLLETLSPICRSLDAGDRDAGDGGHDHGDFWGCATRVDANQPVAGRLDVSGDLDVFRLRVDGWGFYAFEVRGLAGTLATLMDARGYSLQRVEGDGGGLRIIELLAPGEYFLQVHTAGDGGEYRLRVRRLAAP